MKYDQLTVSLPKLPSVFKALSQLIQQEILIICPDCGAESRWSMEDFIHFDNFMDGCVMSRPETEEDLENVRNGKPAARVIRGYDPFTQTHIVCVNGHANLLENMEMRDP